MEGENEEEKEGREGLRKKRKKRRMNRGSLNTAALWLALSLDCKVIPKLGSSNKSRNYYLRRKGEIWQMGAETR